MEWEMRLPLRALFFASILFTSAFAEDSSPIIGVDSNKKELFNFLPSGWRAFGSFPNTIFIDTSFQKVTFWSELNVDYSGSVVVELQGRSPAEAQIYGKLLSPTQSANSAAKDGSGWFLISQEIPVNLPMDPTKTISQLNELQTEIQDLKEDISTRVAEISDLKTRMAAVSNGPRKARLQVRLRAKQQALRGERSLLSTKNQQLQSGQCTSINQSSDTGFVANKPARALITSNSQATCDGWYNYSYSSEMDYGEYLTELKDGLGTMCNLGIVDPNCSISSTYPPNGTPTAKCGLVPNKSPACASVPIAPSEYASISDSFACSAYFDVLSNGSGFDYRRGGVVLSASFQGSTCSLSSRYLIKVELDFPGTIWSSIWDTPYGPEDFSREIEENNFALKDLTAFNSQLGSLSAVSVSFSTDF
jgi:hypothetical protein